MTCSVASSSWSEWHLQSGASRPKNHWHFNAHSRSMVSVAEQCACLEEIDSVSLTSLCMSQLSSDLTDGYSTGSNFLTEHICHCHKIALTRLGFTLPWYYISSFYLSLSHSSPHCRFWKKTLEAEPYLTLSEFCWFSSFSFFWIKNALGCSQSWVVCRLFLSLELWSTDYQSFWTIFWTYLRA